jgi:hypothetical protein
LTKRQIAVTSILLVVFAAAAAIVQVTRYQTP